MTAKRTQPGNQSSRRRTTGSARRHHLSERIDDHAERIANQRAARRSPRSRQPRHRRAHEYLSLYSQYRRPFRAIHLGSGVLERRPRAERAHALQSPLAARKRKTKNESKQKQF